MSKAILIDGNSLLFRAFYATFNPNMPVMKTKDGIPTNAIYAFSNLISKLKEKAKIDDFIVVCFDTGKPSFRKQEFQQYKAQRKPIPEELKVQLPIAREMLDSMNIFHIEKEGYEGDDLIGSFASYFSNKNIDVEIYSSDKDFLQLVSEKITICLLRKGLVDIEVNTPKTIIDHYQLNGQQIIDYKALVGDSSDNYKGVKGIGTKSAMNLLQEFGSLDNIYSNMEKVNPKFVSKLNEGKQEAYLCKHLAEIITDIDITEYVDLTKTQETNYSNLIDFYTKYEFSSLIKKVRHDSNMYTNKSTLTKKNASSISEQKAVNDIKTRTSELTGSDIREGIKLDNNKKLVLEIESLPIDKLLVNPINVDNLETDIPSLSTLNTICYVLDGKNENMDEIIGLVFSDGENPYFIGINKLNDFNNRNVIISLLNSENLINTYNYKNLCVILNRLNLPFPKHINYDLALAFYIIDPSFKDNQYQIQNVIFLSAIQESSYISIFINLSKEIVLQKLDNMNQLSLFVDLEEKLSLVLAKMEINGIDINTDLIKSIKDEYTIRMNKLKEDILSYTTNKEMNINSVNQLSSFLYDELKLASSLKNKNTSAETLNMIRSEHPVIDLIIDYRKYAKIISSYLEKLPVFVSKIDKKIHCKFNQTLTQTGRLSSSDPNMQNISVRDEVGREIRKVFFAPENHKFLSLDYSQIELRMMASLANIKTLIDVFNKDEDIHVETASKIFNVKKEEVTSLMRRRAKAVNFGIIYRITAHGLATDLNIPYKQAKDFISLFKEHYPEIVSFTDQVIFDARKDLYVKTITNRIRYLEEINSQNHVIRNSYERMAVNTVIQGSAADLMKIALVKCFDFLHKNNYKTKMILTIHDEIVFDVPDEEMFLVKDKLVEIMENAIKLKCKLKVSVSVGQTLYDLKD